MIKCTLVAKGVTLESFECTSSNDSFLGVGVSYVCVVHHVSQLHLAAVGVDRCALEGMVKRLS
jgi:hypothetical protein